MKYLSLAIDFLALMAYIYLVPVLAQKMSGQSLWNTAIILAAYFVMCAGIFVARQLEPNPDRMKASESSQVVLNIHQAKAETEQGYQSMKLAASPVVLWLCWPFAIFVLVMTLMAGGFLENNSPSSLMKPGGPEGLTLALAVLTFLVVMVLFPMLMYWPIHPRIPFGTPTHAILRTLSVVGVDAMVIVTTAFWQWQFMDTEPMKIALAGKILVFVLAYIFFLMFYAPPRLAILSLEQSPWSITGFLALLGIMVWRFIR